jgi:hypothetical protein
MTLKRTLLKVVLLKVFFASLFFLQAEAATTTLGNEGAHGGAGVSCSASNYNNFDGFYMLDYVLMRGGEGTGVYPYPDAFAEMSEYNQILDWIYNNIVSKLPVFANDFSEFRRYIFTDDLNSPIRWYPQRRLPRIWDQGLGRRRWQSEEEINFRSRALPTNCPFRMIVQTAVKYRSDDGDVSFGYVPRLVNLLAASGPLQVSFLVVHEWLRSYTNDAEPIRRANRLFHSTAIVELDQQQLRDLLHEIGIMHP